MKYAITNKETHQTRILHLQKIAELLNVDVRTLAKRLNDNWLDTETHTVSEYVPEPKAYSKIRK